MEGPICNLDLMICLGGYCDWVVEEDYFLIRVFRGEGEVELRGEVGGVVGCGGEVELGDFEGGD